MDAKYGKLLNSDSTIEFEKWRTLDAALKFNNKNENKKVMNQRSKQIHPM